MNIIECKRFIEFQLDNLIPNIDMSPTQIDLEHIEITHERFKKCAANIRIFKGDTNVDPYHIMKWPIFLYLLSNTIHLKHSENDKSRIKDRIHSLNKALHGCSISYKIQLPEVFFFNYATNISLTDTTYGNNLVLYHGVTIGALPGGDKPIIGSNVLVEPNVLISGKTIIGNNVVILPNQCIINKTIPDNCIVFENGNILRNDAGDYIKSYLNKL